MSMSYSSAVQSWTFGKNYVNGVYNACRVSEAQLSGSLPSGYFINNPNNQIPYATIAGDSGISYKIYCTSQNILKYNEFKKLTGLSQTYPDLFTQLYPSSEDSKSKNSKFAKAWAICAQGQLAPGRYDANSENPESPNIIDCNNRQLAEQFARINEAASM